MRYVIFFGVNVPRFAIPILINKFVIGELIEKCIRCKGICDVVVTFRACVIKLNLWFTINECNFANLQNKPEAVLWIDCLSTCCANAICCNLYRGTDNLIQYSIHLVRAGLIDCGPVLNRRYYCRLYEELPFLWIILWTDTHFITIDGNPTVANIYLFLANLTVLAGAWFECIKWSLLLWIEFGLMTKYLLMLNASKTFLGFLGSSGRTDSVF